MATTTTNNTRKGTKQNPQHVTVRQESSKNKTLTITLSKSVVDILDDKIKKGDVLVEWADPHTKTIYLRRVSTTTTTTTTVH